MMLTRVLAVSSAVFALSSGIAFAQFDTPALDGALTISSSPVSPAPGESVTLTLISPVYDLGAATILWRLDGKTLTEGVGQTSVTLTAPALGITNSVEADVSSASGASSAAMTLAPSRVDLIWESDSYTPPFYAGKALPSAGSHVRLLAIPFIPKPGGGMYDAKDLRFSWQLNDGALASLSGKGKNAITIGAPALFGSYTVSVSVTTADGSRAGAASATIDSVEPHLALYINHPLYGRANWQALNGTAFIEDSETAFVAIPYFAPSASASNPALIYTWQVNGNAITTDHSHPNEITLSGLIGATAVLNLELTHATNLLLDSRGSWDITFTGNAGSGTSGTNDPFHQQ